jgi:5-methylcytosine-specific restriction endonuclease McrA
VNRFYPRVSARALHVCEYCHAPEAVFNLPFEVEHIIPQALGGESRLENLALSCRSCNLYKSDFTTAFDELT